MAYSSQETKKAPAGDPKDAVQELKNKQNYFRLWATSTYPSRAKMRRDMEYTEGNGRQWLEKDAREVRKSGRPVLEFNQVLPQVELVCGMQRAQQLDYVARPRGLEDARLGEILTASLKACADFTRLSRTSDRVFDDGIITGLGVWEVLHTFDDADDLASGDIVISRINPLSFIYDPWSTADMQQGEFMGKATWLSLGEFIARYPDKKKYAVPGEWLTSTGRQEGSSDDLGTGYNLIPELYDQETGRIRLLTMWCKKPAEITLVVDHNTGRVMEAASKDKAMEFLAAIAEKTGRDSVSQFEAIKSDRTSAIVHKMSGAPIPDPETQQPMVFADPESADSYMNEMSRRAGFQVYEQFEVITRKARRPEWTEMVWWEELDSGVSQYKDRNYPYVPYVSRQFSDDPESIIGIVRILHDPQDEYNKRYSNLLAHLNSSSHSGWLNRKSGGANKRELELMGSKPGVVVEFASVAPQQIQPTEISQGHFTMLQTSAQNIMKISGVNAEMVGATTQATVSGRAIKARQSGGTTILKPRFRTFEDAQLDLTKMLVSRIQQFYPPEKIRRIIGMFESINPLMGPAGTPLFQDPVTGMPMPEDMILQELKNMTNIQFDISLALRPFSDSERQAQFEQALQVAGIITQTGRPLGPGSIQALVDLADMPTRLAEGLKRDAMMPPVMPPGQNPASGAIKNAQDENKAGKKGNSGEGPSAGHSQEPPAGEEG